MNRSIHLNATIINTLQEENGHKRKKKLKQIFQLFAPIHFVTLKISELNRDARIGEFRREQYCNRCFENSLVSQSVKKRKINNNNYNNILRKVN